jgi:hypothetical protein
VCVCNVLAVCAWGAVLSPLVTNHTRLAAVVRLRWCAFVVLARLTCWSYTDLRRKVTAADCWCETAFLSCSSRPAPWASMCGEFAVGVVFAQVVTVHSLVFASFLPL